MNTLQKGVKISLIILSAVVVILLIVLMYFVLVAENSRFENSMLIPFAIIFTGILGLAYQIITFKFYKKDNKIFTINNVVFWIANLLFSFFLFATGLYLIYLIYFQISFNTDVRTEVIISFLISFSAVILAVGLAIEETKLYRYIKNQEYISYKESIEDIKGHQDEDFL